MAWEKEDEMKTRKPWRTRMSFLVATTLFLVAASDWLFYNQPVGWNTGLWELAVMIVVILTHRDALRTWPGRALMVALIGLSAALMAQPGPLVVLMGALGVLSLALLGRSGWQPRATEWVRRWTMFALTGGFQMLKDLLLYQRWRHKGHGSPLFARLLLLGRRWLLPSILTVVFLSLFALANPLISKSLNDLDILLQRLVEELHVDVVRIFFWCFVAIGSWALLRKRIKRAKTAIQAPPWIEPQGFPGQVVRCLLLFNALFAIQNLLDLRYLYGGAALPSGMTYAEYAHRGAYPLIATALLAGAFVLITFRPGGMTQQLSAARRLVVAWLAQNVFLTLSALWRLHLYVQVYSLTRWRVAAAVWMLLVAAGLAWTALRIVSDRPNEWLVNVNFATTLFALYCCCFVNFNGMIAWYNVRHCREITSVGVNIDVSYLRDLGPEAIPALEWFSEKVGETRTKNVASLAVSNLKGDLDRQMSNWRGWTLRNYALRDRTDISRAETQTSAMIRPGGGLLCLQAD
jgi:hypothetical protein